MADHYEIAVIGAGPAGSMAARTAAESGKRVCLFERNSEPGTPVRCGEGIGYNGLHENVNVKPDWIKNAIKRTYMISPSGIKVQIDNIEESYILDRQKMDSDLAKEAVKSGAELFVSSPVENLSRIDKNIYEISGPSKKVTANCVIIADGVESRLARLAGWNTSLKLKDVETCAFAKVVSPLIDRESCVFYTGTKVAPGGYAWIFPRSAGEANVGLGILGPHSGPGKAKELLEKFIDYELPGSKISNLHCGGVPVAKYIRPLVRDGVMLAGDAARQVNSVSGAGIAYALFAGKAAGKTAAEAINGNSIDYNHLRMYEKIWKKRFGRQQDRSYSLKEFVVKTDDGFLDRIAASLVKEDPKKMNYLRVFAKAFSGRPLLLLKAVKLFR
jgi:digeranylgeranylglycerophospholipid reductase